MRPPIREPRPNLDQGPFQFFLGQISVIPSAIPNCGAVHWSRALEPGIGAVPRLSAIPNCGAVPWSRALEPCLGAGHWSRALELGIGAVPWSRS
jgi:hypothetical protein